MPKPFKTSGCASRRAADEAYYTGQLRNERNIGTYDTRINKPTRAELKGNFTDRPTYEKASVFDIKNPTQISAEELKEKHNLTIDPKLLKQYEEIKNDKGNNIGFRMELADGTKLQFENENQYGKFNNAGAVIKQDEKGLYFKGFKNGTDIIGGGSAVTFDGCGNLNFMGNDEMSADDITLKKTYKANIYLGDGADKVTSDENSSAKIIKTGGSLNTSGKNGKNKLYYDADKNGYDDRYDAPKSSLAKVAREMEKNSIFTKIDLAKK